NRALRRPVSLCRTFLCRKQGRQPPEILVQARKPAGELSAALLPLSREAKLQVAEGGAQRDVAPTDLLAQPRRAGIQRIERSRDLVPLLVERGRVDERFRARTPLIDMGQRAVANAVGKRLHPLRLGAPGGVAREYPVAGKPVQ